MSIYGDKRGIVYITTATEKIVSKQDWMYLKSLLLKCSFYFVIFYYDMTIVMTAFFSLIKQR